MTAPANLLTPTQFARPLRAAAVFIAVASAVWEVGDYLSGELELRSLVMARALVVVAATAIALTTGILIAAALLMPQATVLALALSLLAAVAAVLIFNRIAIRKIGGHTGDTIGATQQLTEMSVLFALALAL